MITNAEIINQPYAGEFEERVYDNDNSWNSQSWTWIKFTENSQYEWVGQFRGAPIGVGISTIHSQMLIVTSDYLFLLNQGSGQLLEFKENNGYNALTVSPKGDFIIGNYFNIDKIGKSLQNIRTIEGPIGMDRIEFKKWEGNKLNFSCDEFANWDRHLDMELDTGEWKIKIKPLPNNK
ncbi:hypothetical protein [Pontibacter amylolyticus]|uniref:DUF1349 domain-containing protein n=1 Tax=Pontibacter amylolyticus TaxID=1424080 RepID=A0ABQ1VVX0_9BACT|nr:hypothetical protein [Pontibacter amylolyticus]GGG01987.1 hypothetical protein GCM10011323_03530 [Pontibacter amylolyticus]